MVFLKHHLTGLGTKEALSSWGKSEIRTFSPRMLCKYCSSSGFKNMSVNSNDPGQVWTWNKMNWNETWSFSMWEAVRCLDINQRDSSTHSSDTCQKMCIIHQRANINTLIYKLSFNQSNLIKYRWHLWHYLDTWVLHLSTTKSPGYDLFHGYFDYLYSSRFWS